MWSNYSDAIIFAATCVTFWLANRMIIGIKARAFNEGFKRGRASINVREVVK
jgi:hypothetical protein